MAHAALAPALSLLLGIVLGVWGGVPTSFAVVTLAAALATATRALAAGRGGVVLVAVTIGWAAAGMVLGGRAEGGARDPPLRALLGAGSSGPITVVGVLTQDAAVVPNGVSLSLKVREWHAGGRPTPAAGGIAVTVGGQPDPRLAATWTAGRVVSVPVWLREAARYRDPGVPDHALALARRGIALVGTVKSASLVEVVAAGGWVDEAAAAIRRYVRQAVGQTIGRRSPRAGGVVIAILIGDRSGLDPADERRLQEAGTYHVMAISGGNIAILAACLLLGVRVLRVPFRAGLAVTAAALAMYVPVAGGGSSVLRATLTAIVYLAARAIDQRSAPSEHARRLGHPHPLWLAAGAGGSLVPPHLRRGRGHRGPGAADGGGAPTGRGSCVPPRRWWRRPWPPRLPSCRSARRSSIASPSPGWCSTSWPSRSCRWRRSAAWWPWSFTRQRPPPPDRSRGCRRSRPTGSSTRRRSSRGCRGRPGGWPRRRAGSSAAYYAGLIAWLGRARWGPGARVPRAMAHGAALATLVGSAAWVVAAPSADSWRASFERLTVTALDVGQGDATIVRLPGGRTLLVDAGGLGGGARFDVGERVVAPAAWALGVRRLHAFVATHGDADHAGGAASAVTMLRAEEVWEGVPVRDDPELAELRGAAAATGMVWRTVQSGDVVRDHEVAIRVLHPPLPDWERRRVRNDDSVVLEIRYGAVSFVLAGDAGVPVEPAIAAGLDRSAALRVLKVGHHGSAGSTSVDFLRAVRPTVAIVSCGRQNRFGHPAPVVVDRLFASGAALFRTDLQGAVSVETDGRSLTVRTFTGEKVLFRVANGKAVAGRDASTAGTRPPDPTGVVGAIDAWLRSTRRHEGPRRRQRNTPPS